MKVTTLIENRRCESDPRLAAEWGLSLHIAFDGGSILFDTGASGSFADNARRLFVGLADVDAAVLSHHHYDHGGGLRRFLELNSKAKVYLGEAPDGECVARSFGFLIKGVGLENGLAADHEGRFETVAEPVQILPEAYVLPRISGRHPRPEGNRRLLLRKGGALGPDSFFHEIVLVIREGDGLVVFSGCSHTGILNVVDTVSKAFIGIPIRAVIGGFHLIPAGPLRRMAGGRRAVEEIGRALLDYPVGQAYTCHCTGDGAFKVLKEVMGHRIADIRTGSSFEV